MDTSPKVDSSKKEQKEAVENASDIQLRPSAGNGWWLNFLLVAAYLVNYWKYERSASFEYKFSTLILIGLALQTEVIHWIPKIKNGLLRKKLHAVPPAAVSLLLIYVLRQGVVFSLFSGLATVATYQALFSFTLRKMPMSFTYGEASIVLQGFVIFLTNLYFKLIHIAKKTSECVQDSSNSVSCVVDSNNYWTKNLSEMEQLSTILQIGLLGVAFLVGCCYFVKFVRGVFFYAVLAAVGTAIILFPIDDEVAVVILFNFLTQDLQKLCMILLYVGLLGMTVATVIWQVQRQQKSNTRTRKIFHGLIVLVFVPGLIYQCAFLFVASGIALALMIVLETMRVIQLPPVHGALEHAVKCFIDEKDAGMVALTPIYLLVGCSTPLWLHPCPCDLTDSAGFELLPLMAGVISVGIGDTAASIIGSRFGKIKWPKTTAVQKTVEGTGAATVAQGLVLPVLIYFGLVRYSTLLTVKFLIAVTTNSLIETFTDQVDNLVLPLVTFILLSL